MRSRIIGLIVVLLLTGCAPPRPFSWWWPEDPHTPANYKQREWEQYKQDHPDQCK